MPKFLAGFAFGVVITIAAYSLLDTSSREASIPQIDRLESVESAPSAVVADADQQRPDSQAAEDSEERNLPLAESVPSLIPTASPVESSSATSSIPTNLESPPGTTGKPDYSAYPPEIAEILDTKNPHPLQTRYEAEEREDSWAAYMQGQLAAYFAQKPELAQFSISLIDCRRSVCEIHAIGYGLDARATWTTATADIVQQPWHDFNQMSMSTRDPDPGIFAVVLILAKKPE